MRLVCRINHRIAISAIIVWNLLESSFCEEKFICLNAFHRNVALECNKDSTNVAEMRERNLVVHFNCKSELDGSAHLKTETNITKVLWFSFCWLSLTLFVHMQPQIFTLWICDPIEYCSSFVIRFPKANLTN